MAKAVTVAIECHSALSGGTRQVFMEFMAFFIAIRKFTDISSSFAIIE
jgi:hypothetical protein